MLWEDRTTGWVRSSRITLVDGDGLRTVDELSESIPAGTIHRIQSQSMGGKVSKKPPMKEAEAVPPEIF